MVWIAIAVGGALGSMARHGINVLVQSRWPMMRFPLATFVVNVAGCLVIGVLAGLIMAGRITPRLYWREFVFVGLLGGFTTFSTFGLDTFLLARSHSTAQAALNVGLQVIGGLAVVWLGYLIGTMRPLRPLPWVLSRKKPIQLAVTRSAVRPFRLPLSYTIGS
jgi:CrcB protein